MREARHAQLSLTESFSEHETGQQLKHLSRVLDQHPELVDWVHADLTQHHPQATGSKGLTSESVLRCLLIKQLFQFSYEQMAFHLSDSATYRAFARLPMGVFPSRSSLQSSIRTIQPMTLQTLNTKLIRHWLNEGIVNIEHLRIDSTVIKSHIASPSDSQLLDDGVRVLSRLLAKSKDDTGIRFRFTDQRKASKSLAFRIFNAKQAEKDHLYPQLLRIAERVLKQVDRALNRITSAPQWRERLIHSRDLLVRVIHQTTRRVIDQQQVPASEKIVSLFETHTDIIIKGFRDVQFGHKVNLSSDASGFLTYCCIEEGNTSDKELFLPVLRAHQSDYQRLPKRTIADGGYASQANVLEGRQLGVQAVAFQKPVGLTLSQMGLTQKTLTKLANFRAGIEGNISELKRRFGCSMARWKGKEGFQAFVWSSILTYNLIRLVRLQQ